MTIISIVNFNTRELTRNCLKSILGKRWEEDIKIFVVDNGSTDGSVEMLGNQFPQVKLIVNKNNLGFGKAHNQILSKGKGDYYMVLNSDTEIEEGLIDNMVKFMEEYKSCGISSCRVLGFDGKLQPNGGDLPLGRALFNWLFNLEVFSPSSFHRNEEEYYKKIHPVGWVSGNFMFIRRKVIEQVGKFNENYFMYFEDVEYCFRVKRAGLNVMINPKVSMKHLSGGSLDDPKFRQWIGEYKGLIIFYNQHFGIGWAILVKIVCYFAIMLRIIAFLLAGKIKYSLTYGKIIANF